MVGACAANLTVSQFIKLLLNHYLRTSDKLSQNFTERAFEQISSDSSYINDGGANDRDANGGGTSDGDDALLVEQAGLMGRHRPRQVDRGAGGETPGPGESAATQGQGREYRVYHRFRDGARVAGVYRPDLTNRSRVFELTHGPAHLVGSCYKSPSGAAVAIVRARDPERAHPNTDGWLFWRILGHGGKLDRVRGANAAAYGQAGQATGDTQAPAEL